MKTAAIAKLKASLSQYLESVKAGEHLIVTDRGRPVAMIVPIHPSVTEDERRAEMIAQGLIKPGKGPVPWERIEKMRACLKGVTGEEVLRIIQEDREDRV